MTAYLGLYEAFSTKMVHGLHSPSATNAKSASRPNTTLMPPKSTWLGCWAEQIAVPMMKPGGRLNMLWKRWWAAALAARAYSTLPLPHHSIQICHISNNLGFCSRAKRKRIDKFELWTEAASFDLLTCTCCQAKSNGTLPFDELFNVDSLFQPLSNSRELVVYLCVFEMAGIRLKGIICSSCDSTLLNAQFNRRNISFLTRCS